MADESFDALLRGFLAAEAARAADAAPPVSRVLARLESIMGAEPEAEPLRRASGVVTTARGLSPTTRLLLVLAALIAALAIGTGIALVGTHTTTPTPIPTQQPLSVPLDSQATLMPDHPYLFPIGSRSVVGIVASVPDESLYPLDGWRAVWTGQDQFSLWGPPHMSLAFVTPDDVYRDACHRTSGPMGVRSGLDAFVAGLEQSLANSPGVTVAEVGESPLLDGMTLGGRPVRALAITMAADVSRLTCDLESVLPLHLPSDVGGVRVDSGDLIRGAGIYPGESLTLLVVDVGGQIVVVESDTTVYVCDVETCGATPGSGRRVEDQRAVLASVAWTSPPDAQPPVAADPLTQGSLPPGVTGQPPLPGGYLRPDATYDVSIGTEPAVDLSLRPPEPILWMAGTGSQVADTGPYSQVLSTGRFLTLGYGIAIQIVDSVHTDSCAWNEANALVQPRDMAGLASALGTSLAKIPRAEVSPPVVTTVGNRSALKLSVSVPQSALQGCYLGSAIPWTLPFGPGPSTDGVHIQVGGVYDVYVLDVHGAQVIVVAWSDINRPDEADAVQALLDAIAWR